MDSFAQTASVDDLFMDDDIIPVAEPVVEQAPAEDLPTETEIIPTEPTQQAYPAHNANGQNGNDGQQPRGGYRGRGRANKRGAFTSREQNKKPENTNDNVLTVSADKRAKPSKIESDQINVKENTNHEPSEPETKAFTAAVRGDRTLTGGPKRERLTEEELNAKIQAAKTKAEERTAAYERAEADQASFEAREALAAQKMVERRKQLAEKAKADRQNRQVMMGERERNRQRKLQAVKGREWDLEKEEGFSGTGGEKRRGAARGAYGGVVTDRQTVDKLAESVAEVAISSSGQRGGTRGRGRGGARGGRSGPSQPSERTLPHNQQVPTAEDFPELPPVAGKSWADQVEGE